MRVIAALLISLAYVYAPKAQVPLYQAAENIPFLQQGRELANPLTGGVEAPQFTMINLNNDHLEDLLVFDRIGAKALPFLAFSTPEGIQYRYAPSYETELPPLNQMAKVIDLNCDGLGDLLTTEALSSASDVALKAYLRQPSSDGNLTFQTQRLQLRNSPGDTLVRTHAFDLPAVADINGDGLPDLLYIPRGGTQIHYYENTSLQSGSCDSLTFELRDDCWGGATYTLEGDFELYACEPGRFFNPSGCAGSTMLLLDEDSNGVQDLLFSGLYDFHIQLLSNSGDVQQAELSSSSTNWLNGGEALLEFPAPYLLDLEGEAQADLIVATNRINGAGFSPYSNNIYHFRKDVGDGSWNMQSQRFMIKDMIDPGFRSSPVIYDVDEDGLPDLLMAYNSAHPIYGYTSRIALYLNTGTTTEPAFSLSTDDFGTLSIYNLKAIHPAIGDLTGDGIPELVLGLEDGRLQIYSNSESTLSNYFPMDPNPLMETTLYGYARPQLIDVDENGTLDLLCGARNGAMALIENSGTASMPQFTLVRDTLGGVLPEGYFQECSPFFLKQADGSYIIYYARIDGKVSLYQGQLDEDFTLLAPELPVVDVGVRATITLHDLNADGQPELIMGNMRGGLEIFEASLFSSAAEPMASPLSVKAIPNPARNETSIEINGTADKATLLLFDTRGRLLRSEEIMPGGSPHRLTLYGLETGLYVYRIHSAGRVGVGKLIIIK